MPGHDDYLDFNMWLTAQGELYRVERLEKDKLKVYAWDRSAKKEQKKLEQEQQDIKNLSLTITQYWSFICSNKIYWGELEKLVRPLLEKYNLILEN